MTGTVPTVRDPPGQHRRRRERLCLVLKRRDVWLSSWSGVAPAAKSGYHESDDARQPPPYSSMYLHLFLAFSANCNCSM